MLYHVASCFKYINTVCLKIFFKAFQIFSTNHIRLYSSGLDVIVVSYVLGFLGGHGGQGFRRVTRIPQEQSGDRTHPLMAATAGSTVATPRPGWVAFSDEESQAGMYQQADDSCPHIGYLIFEHMPGFLLYPGQTEHLLYSCS